jgi:hypothetical protein
MDLGWWMTKSDGFRNMGRNGQVLDNLAVLDYKYYTHYIVVKGINSCQQAGNKPLADGLSATHQQLKTTISTIKPLPITKLKNKSSNNQSITINNSQTAN